MTITCSQCQLPKEVHCTEEQVLKWRAGALIQNAMPHVPKEERELLISGTCADCWKRMFAVDEEDD